MKLTVFFAALLILFTSKSAEAQTVSRLRFDFSDSQTPTLDSFTRVSPQDIFAKNGNFGWTKPPVGTFDRAEFSRSRNAMLKSGVLGKTLGFKAKIPNGSWVLTFWTETGIEDSSTQTVKIGGKNVPPQYQDFFKPAEPRNTLKSTYRIFHQRIMVGNNGFDLQIDGGKDSVRLLGLVLEKGDSSNLTQQFYQDYTYWLEMRGWEWATQKTGLGIFDRYEMALVNLDAYLKVAKSSTTQYQAALLDKARILFWTDREVHCESHRLQAQAIFQRLNYDKKNPLFDMYLGKKIPSPCACDSLKMVWNAPDWSKAQREAHCQLKRLADWWIQERQAENGEFGGKIDDDVELLRCLTPLVLRGDKAAIQGWTKLANGVWTSPQMDSGFLKRVRDVEHAAEYFSDTGPMMLLLSDDSVFVNRLRPTTRFFENTWTGKTTKGNRLFKSAWLSSTAIDTATPRNRDLPFSCLAAKPMRFLAWKTGDAHTLELLHEWAKTWRDLSLSTAKGKPRGIVPPSVRFPDEAINGDEKNWWRANMFWHYFEWDYGTYWKMYDQFLLTAQLTGDSSLLQPLIETLNLIKKHENTGNTEGVTAGSEKWAALNLTKETGFWTVVSAWRFWSNDARFDDLLKKYGSPYLRFRLTGDESDLAKGYQKMLTHLRVNFPILTNEALFTDRVYLTADDEYDPADYARALLTGDEIQISASPYPSVTWAECPDDLTVLVSESSPKSLIIKLFSHAAEKKNATVRLWQLETGTYQVSFGNQNKPIKLTERGQRFSFAIDPSVLHTLTFKKIGE